MMYKMFLKLFGFFLLAIISINSAYAEAEEEYILGSDDIVRISVYGQKDLETVARINELGKITFPLIRIILRMRQK